MVHHKLITEMMPSATVGFMMGTPDARQREKIREAP